MRSCFARPLFLSLFIATAALVGPTVAKAAGADDQVLAELNFARQHPQEYAELLIREPVSSWERTLASHAASDQDAAAYAQAIEFLKRQSPLPALRPDDQLTAAALEHVAAQGPAGQIGHDGPAGERFDARLRRHGVEAQVAAEDIAYGPRDPRDVVRELIIDRGVPDRGHRRNIFLRSVEVAGVSCGPHRDYDVMCVIDFASPSSEQDLRPKLEMARLELMKVDLVSGEQVTCAPDAIEFASAEPVKTFHASQGALRQFLRRLLG